MCNINITLSDTLVEKARISFPDNKALELWLNQQLEEYLLSQYLQQELLHDSSTNDQTIPDIVLSLLGAGLP